MQSLKLNTIYTHSGNLFSRAFLVRDGVDVQKKVIIFDSDAELRVFQRCYDAVADQASVFIKTASNTPELFFSTRWTFLVSKDILLGSTPDFYQYTKKKITIIGWQKISKDDLVKLLIDAEYSFDKHLEKSGVYKAEGDTVTIRTFYDDTVLTISFFGNEIDGIFEFDSVSGEIKKQLKEATLYGYFWERLLQNNSLEVIFQKIHPACVVFSSLDFWENLSEAKKYTESYIDFSEVGTKGIDLGREDVDIENLDGFQELLKKNGSRISIYTRNRKTVERFCEYNDVPKVDIFDIGNISAESFCYEEKKWKQYVITDDVIGNIFVKKRYKRTLAKNLDLLLQIKSGDYVVHVDHGVGIFRQIILKDLSGVKREYVEVEYRESDKLFVPVSELHRLSKYIWNEDPKLTRLDSTEWSKVVRATEVEVEQIARELLEMYANRAIAKGYSFFSFPKEEMAFRKAFPYAHTDDQETSIEEVLEDMASENPMDRLLSWDVGFGKTEVAMNAIYRAFLNRKQSALISPLVVLAFEHYESLQKRLESFWVNVAILTRVSTTREEKDTLKWLRDGTIHCVVGTHRLLSEDISFKNLGLLVVDEEHKFWVMDKERLKKLRANLDILSLSATPIPRSLNLALNGVKKVSVLTTPPPMKKAIKTLAAKYDLSLIKEAVEFEFARDGQVIFIHNRIQTIETLKSDLEKLLWKKAKIIITHGQMNGEQLEDRILDFKLGKYNILLSTTVIENGVNFLHANTIFIDDAGSFWLSQLHQLRGRVWRKDIEGHCYLLYRKDILADDAKKRIITIVNHSHLGAGFEIAMRDLEIRGAWDILGIKQSGRSKETGLSLYLQLLEQKIEELKTGQSRQRVDCKIELDISYYISDDFFASEVDKIAFFRNLESMENEADLDFTYDTFRQGFDELPEAVENLFLVLKARLRLAQYWVCLLKKVMHNYFFEFDRSTDVPKLRKFMELDRTGDFVIVTAHKVRVETKHWKNHKDFLRSLLGI